MPGVSGSSVAGVVALSRQSAAAVGRARLTVTGRRAWAALSLTGSSAAWCVGPPSVVSGLRAAHLRPATLRRYACRDQTAAAGYRYRYRYIQTRSTLWCGFPQVHVRMQRKRSRIDTHGHTLTMHTRRFILRPIQKHSHTHNMGQTFTSPISKAVPSLL